MGYFSQLDIERQNLEAAAANNAAIIRSRLVRLHLKLSEADALADAVRDYTRAVFSSDEPYEHARALSGRVSAALLIVEDMIEDMGERA